MTQGSPLTAIDRHGYIPKPKSPSAALWRSVSYRGPVGGSISISSAS